MTMTRLGSRTAALAFALAATTPALAQTVLSPPLGVVSGRLPRGETGLALPLTTEDVFVGVAESNTGSSLTFPAAAGDLAALLAGEGRYYVEVVAGPRAGERFDVDAAATTGSTLALALGTGSFSTLPVLADGALTGARCAVRPHLTPARLQALLTPGLAGRDNPLLADGIALLEGGQLALYYLRADGATWRRLGGGAADFRHKVLPPDGSFVVSVRSGPQSWAQPGRVRLNAFRKNLVPGLQSFASGFPVDLSPAQLRAFSDPAAPPATRWTGNNVFLLADQIELLLRPGRPLDIFFLRGDGTTWRALGSPADVAHQPIVGATGMTALRRIKPDPAYSVPPPFEP
jgi:hypothetical protein